MGTDGDGKAWLGMNEYGWAYMSMYGHGRSMAGYIWSMAEAWMEHGWGMDGAWLGMSGAWITMAGVGMEHAWAWLEHGWSLAGHGWSMDGHCWSMDGHG